MLTGPGSRPLTLAEKLRSCKPQGATKKERKRNNQRISGSAQFKPVLYMFHMYMSSNLAEPQVYAIYKLKSKQKEVYQNIKCLLLKKEVYGWWYFSIFFLFSILYLCVFFMFSSISRRYFFIVQIKDISILKQHGIQTQRLRLDSDLDLILHSSSNGSRSVGGLWFLTSGMRVIVFVLCTS